MSLQREHGEQSALVRWWAYEANRRGLDQRLLVATPNQGRTGGWKAARRGAWLKDEGLRAGFPDLGLFIPSQGHHGLFIEMKSEGGRVSPAQDEMMRLLSEQGYLCLVAFGFEDAKNQILAYLGAPQ